MEVLHLDDHVLILNKPSGLSVLPEGWDRDAPNLIRQLEEKYGKTWVVHRLDKVTSGLMVFARTAEAHRELNRQFEHHEVQKIYHAIAVGVPGWEQETAKHPLRVNVGHKHRTAVDPKTGKTSETRFKVLKRYQAHILLEAQPVTGRTHQVRAHAAALGYPLLGDILYGAPETDLIARPALHACSLTLYLPDAGNWSLNPEHRSLTTFSAPYPDDFDIALKCLSNDE